MNTLDRRPREYNATADRQCNIAMGVQSDLQVGLMHDIHGALAGGAVLQVYSDRGRRNNGAAVAYVVFLVDVHKYNQLELAVVNALYVTTPITAFAMEVPAADKAIRIVIDI